MTTATLPAPAGFFSSPEKLRTIRLYGKLGATFGRVHRFVCTDTAGAIRALCAMLPGFEAHLLQSKDRGLGYAVFIGKQNIREDMLAAPVGDDDIRIAPVVLGSGRGGFLNIVLGVVLVAAAFWTGGASMAAWGFGSKMMFGMGVSMLLGGVSQMLVRQPKGLTGVESPDNGASYNFNGPVNVTAQGNPVPVLYGEMIVGSVTISGEISSEDQLLTPTAQNASPKAPVPHNGGTGGSGYEQGGGY